MPGVYRLLSKFKVQAL